MYCCSGSMHLEAQGDLFHAYTRRPIRQGREEGAKNEITYVLRVARMGEKFGDEGEKSIELYVGIMQSFIVGSQKGRRRAGNKA